MSAPEPLHVTPNGDILTSMTLEIKMCQSCADTLLMKTEKQAIDMGAVRLPSNCAECAAIDAATFPAPNLELLPATIMLGEQNGQPCAVEQPMAFTPHDIGRGKTMSAISLHSGLPRPCPGTEQASASTTDCESCINMNKRINEEIGVALGHTLSESIKGAPEVVSQTIMITGTDGNIRETSTLLRSPDGTLSQSVVRDTIMNRVESPEILEEAGTTEEQRLQIHEKVLDAKQDVNPPSLLITDNCENDSTMKRIMDNPVMRDCLLNGRHNAITEPMRYQHTTPGQDGVVDSKTPVVIMDDCLASSGEFHKDSEKEFVQGRHYSVDPIGHRPISFIPKVDDTAPEVITNSGATNDSPSHEGDASAPEVTDAPKPVALLGRRRDDSDSEDERKTCGKQPVEIEREPEVAVTAVSAAEPRKLSRTERRNLERAAAKQAKKDATGYKRNDLWTRELRLRQVENIKGELVKLDVLNLIPHEIMQMADNYVETGDTVEHDYDIGELGRTFILRLYNERWKKSFANLKNTSTTLRDEKQYKRYKQLEEKMAAQKRGGSTLAKVRDGATGL
jgi:hypothetical protein